MVVVELFEWRQSFQSGNGGCLNGSKRVVANQPSLVRGDSRSTVLWRAYRLQSPTWGELQSSWGLSTLIDTDRLIV